MDAEDVLPVIKATRKMESSAVHSTAMFGCGHRMVFMAFRNLIFGIGKRITKTSVRQALD